MIMASDIGIDSSNNVNIIVIHQVLAGGPGCNPARLGLAAIPDSATPPQ
jgi:hypothetical protein